jgi:hypothetical protein
MATGHPDLPDWIVANLLRGFVLRRCPDHGLTSAELDLARNVETGEQVDWCHAGEHFVPATQWQEMS